jgi:ring-1,2-phenylacetyl-CoA epoxidase subunit PaaD
MEHEANGGHPTGGQAKWGQIKIQDDQAPGDESTSTKFCSDPTLRSPSLATKSATKPNATLEKIWQLLEQVPDPEIPVVSIRELGILRDVRQAADGSIEVVITPTYSGCPAMGQIEDDVQAALQTAGLQAKLITQLAPAWTTDWMTNSAKTKLRDYGIAPPMHAADHIVPADKVIQFAIKSRATNDHTKRTLDQIDSKNVPCPRCQSTNTTETSHFASTACKALYKCLDCMEPFDYFKPY